MLVLRGRYWGVVAVPARMSCNWANAGSLDRFEMEQAVIIPVSSSLLQSIACCLSTYVSFMFYARHRNDVLKWLELLGLII